MVKLGDRARDTISKLEGCVTGRAEYLYTAPMVQVVLDGAKESWWVDETRMEVVVTPIQADADRL